MTQQTVNGGDSGTLASKLKVPAIAGGAAVAGLVGGVAISGHKSRRTVLGMRLPRATARPTSENLAEAARQIGSFGDKVGLLANEIRVIREGVTQSRTRSPIEVVLQGLTSRKP